MSLRAILWLSVSTKAQAADDKVSLPQQEADERALCEREGWEIVDILRVPGHSRDYLDIHECAADMQKQGISAFYRLLDHWERADFDLLVCRDSERFARTQSLHAYVVERTIKIGGRIYSLADGMVDQHNFRMFTAMAGYKAASDIDRLRKGRNNAMNARAARGLPTSSGNILSHVVVRDELGRAQRLVVDETKRRLFDDLAKLILDGIGWRLIEEELFKLGHTRADGKPYNRVYFYTTVHHPTWWGHSARFFRDKRFPNTTKTDMWVFDDSEPLPDGVMIFRNTHEPVWTGELAEQVKAELRRRRLVVRGQARPTRTRAFSGLVVCGECGYYLVYGYNKGYPNYKCVSHWWQSPTRPDCSQHAFNINEPRLQGWIGARLKEILHTGDLSVLNTMMEKRQLFDPAARIASLEREVELANTRARKLIAKQADASEELTQLYDEQLLTLGQELRALKDSLTQLRREHISQLEPDVAPTIAEMRELGEELFWQQPSVKINQMLHRLFGKRRLLFLDGEIVKIVPAPRVRNGK